MAEVAIPVLTVPLPGIPPAPAAAPAAKPVVPTPPAAAPPVLPAEPAKPTLPAEDPRLAAVLAKERELVQKQQAFAKERDGHAAERKELETLRSWRAGLVKNPAALSEVLGDDWYEKLTEYRLNGNKITPELVDQRLDARLSEWEKRQQDDRQKSAQEEQKRIQEEQQAVYDRFREDTTEFVKGKGEEYELINLHGAHNLVIQVIENTYAQNKRILSTKEAADFVENHLAEQVRKSLETRKFKTPATGALPEKRSESAQPRTLTNAHGAITAPPPVEEGRVPSDDERLARAIAKGEAVRRQRMGAG